MKTFDEFIYEEQIRRCRSLEKYEVEYLRTAWEACLKANKEPVSEVPCSDRVINALSDKDKAKMFIDLMCIIHRDGGHYMAEHGEQKAFDDAIEKILPLVQEHL